MEFETMKIGSAHYIVKNGVRSQRFTVPTALSCTIYEPQPIQQAISLEAALWLIAEQMDDWYTTAQAAARLVELGAFDKPPSAHDVCMWARHGLLPGSIKITGKGGWGRGGSWRIPASALAEFVERRKGQ